ncbi:inositol monophosphatase family protein [Streptomyces sp. NPDC058622]|uniref:inositol monophosphatase family protein n=1 Tax=Streptomyces sp. NPDC058622 TaxID=3346562 RepID=UPI00364AF9D4
MDIDSDIRLAHRLVDLADAIALRHFRNGPRSHRKADGSPVSEADLAVEKALLEVLAAERPGDSVLSEESGRTPAASGHAGTARRWILDPIDGTIPFLAGERAWGTHVALEVDGALRAVVLSRPTERRRWWARSGSGTYASAGAEPLSAGRRLRMPDDTVALRSARVGGFLFPDSPAARVQTGTTWVDAPVCLIGDLLEGRVDAAVDEGGHVWDRAPAALLVREAGGDVDDLAGGHRLDGPWLVYARRGLAAELTGRLRAQVL